MKVISNEKGMTFLDIITSLIIACIVIIIVGNFQMFFIKMNVHLDEKMLLFNTINNKVAEIYDLEDWGTLTDEKINTEYGDIEITYSKYVKDNKNLTNKITVKFKLNNKEKTYTLERSVYYNK